MKFAKTPLETKTIFLCVLDKCIMNKRTGEDGRCRNDNVSNMRTGGGTMVAQPYSWPCVRNDFV